MSFFADLSHQYIDGAWRTGSGSWDIIDFNPFNGEKLAAITVAGPAEVDEAYAAAERAQPAWGRAAPATRRLVLERAREVLAERRESIVSLLVDEVGGTRAKAEHEILLADEHLAHAARLTSSIDGRIVPAGPGREDRLLRLPAGVVTVISPFNFPLLVTLKSLAPALALGNAVVLKPNQHSPMAGGSLLAKIFDEAGLPAGLLNVLVTDIAEIGDALIEHPVPRVISFAGSDRVGRRIASVAAGHLKRCVLQLGGNSAFVVLDDADLDYAAEAAVFSRFGYQGQVCSAAGRILVDRSVEAEFTEKFLDRVRALRTGDPADPRTDLGPVIDALQADALGVLVEQALAEGATALLRGRTVGNLVEPTVLTGLPADSPLLRQETFGPVALLVPFEGEAEAVRLVNDTPYGLSGAVHTRDVERGVRFAGQVRSGMMHVNDSTLRDEPAIAFGGEKASGSGRLGGDAAVEAFTTQKWISVQTGRTDFPF